MNEMNLLTDTWTTAFGAPNDEEIEALSKVDDELYVKKIDGQAFINFCQEVGGTIDIVELEAVEQFLLNFQGNFLDGEEFAHKWASDNWGVSQDDWNEIGEFINYDLLWDKKLRHDFWIDSETGNVFEK